MAAAANLAFLFSGCAAIAHPVPDDPRWLCYAGGHGPGAGKHIVLIAADQEYRSEQSLPMLARILSARHGFHCTVLFSLDGEGRVNPTLPTRQDVEGTTHDIPGLEHLASADLLILFSRFMSLPDDQLRHLVDYFDSGKPIIALRTANHGFLGRLPYEIDGRIVRFGVDVLGGRFLAHHGGWHRESTRGVVVEAQREHPILRGVTDVWGPSDVYRTYPEGEQLPADCTALVLGQPLTGLLPDCEPNPDKIALPIAWTKNWTVSSGRSARIYHQTMGSARDFESAGLRRLTINAAYWCLGLEAQIDANANVDYVGDYAPLASGFDYEKLGVEPHPPEHYR
ncbi:MAG: ThuA domain-containing protein [Planctomycetes bacterium]|nr:ThuA domain-containing protein [Planctomycetota bacterium]